MENESVTKQHTLTTFAALYVPLPILYEQRARLRCHQTEKLAVAMQGPDVASSIVS